jgi:hypothetical protein
MATKKITAADRLVQEQMLALLGYAADSPESWHDIGKLKASKKAAELLAKRDVIEDWAETNMYRLKKGPVF